jgi:hypothetical protein
MAAPRLNRSVADPCGPTAGNRSFASAAPTWKDAMAHTAASTGSANRTEDRAATFMHMELLDVQATRALPATEGSTACGTSKRSRVGPYR